MNEECIAPRFSIFKPRGNWPTATDSIAICRIILAARWGCGRTIDRDKVDVPENVPDPNRVVHGVFAISALIFWSERSGSVKQSAFNEERFSVGWTVSFVPP